MILKKTRNMGPLHKSVHALIDLRQPPPLDFNKSNFSSCAFASSSLCVTSEAWDDGDHAVGSCLCAADAGGASSCWRLSPHSPHEVHAAHDERADWTPIQRGQGTLRW